MNFVLYFGLTSCLNLILTTPSSSPSQVVKLWNLKHGRWFILELSRGAREFMHSFWRSWYRFVHSKGCDITALILKARYHSTNHGLIAGNLIKVQEVVIVAVHVERGCLPPCWVAVQHDILWDMWGTNVTMVGVRLFIMSAFCGWYSILELYFASALCSARTQLLNLLVCTVSVRRVHEHTKVQQKQRNKPSARERFPLSYALAGWLEFDCLTGGSVFQSVVSPTEKYNYVLRILHKFQLLLSCWYFSICPSFVCASSVHLSATNAWRLVLASCRSNNGHDVNAFQGTSHAKPDLGTLT